MKEGLTGDYVNPCSKERHITEGLYHSLFQQLHVNWTFRVLKDADNLIGKNILVLKAENNHHVTILSSKPMASCCYHPQTKFPRL